PLLPGAIHAAVEDVMASTMHKAITSQPMQTGPQRARQRPGDAFNRCADWASLLQPHGWVPLRQRGDMTHWRRPGKAERISARANYAGSGLLYVFSTNAAPFEAARAYTPFAAYALLDHGGNFAAAAQALQAQGYGLQRCQGFRTMPVHAGCPPLYTRNAQEVQPWRG